MVPELSEWTSLTLDDMTGHGEAEQGEQYHLARGKAVAAGYTVVRVHVRTLLLAMAYSCNPHGESLLQL